MTTTRPELNTLSLQETLREAGVPKDAFRLPGAPLADNTYVLENAGRVWSTYYYEHGSRVDVAQYLSESEACAEMLRRMRRDFPAIPEDATQDVKPWPAWLRYPLIAFLALIVVFGLVSAFNHGVDGGTVRVLVAAVLVPALLAPLVALGSLRRARRAQPPAFRPVTALSVPDLALILRGAGYDAYADRIDTAQQTSNSSTEFLYQGRQILVELLREQPNMHRDRVDEVHTVVANLSALLNDAGDASH